MGHFHADRQPRPIQFRLRTDGAVEFEGMWLRYEGEWTDLAPGDTYAAERNQGPRLLTVKEVVPTMGETDRFLGCVFPVEVAYPYDLGECVKVTLHDTDPRATTSTTETSTSALAGFTRG